MNLDLSNAQYNLESIYTQAQKIGIDVGDMIEYGFESKSGSCGQKYCIDKQQFKDLDQMFERPKQFRQRL